MEIDDKQIVEQSDNAEGYQKIPPFKDGNCSLETIGDYLDY